MFWGWEGGGIWTNTGKLLGTQQEEIGRRFKNGRAREWHQKVNTQPTAKTMSDLVWLKRETKKYGGMHIWTGVLSLMGQGHDWGLNGSETTDRPVVFKVFKLSSNSILKRSLICRMDKSSVSLSEVR